MSLELNADDIQRKKFLNGVPLCAIKGMKGSKNSGINRINY